MQFDANAIDAAVRASVDRLLKADKVAKAAKAKRGSKKTEEGPPPPSVDDEFGNGRMYGRSVFGTASVARRATFEFLVPFVKRALLRRAVADVKRVVRLSSAVGPGKDKALLRSCMLGAAASGKKKPSFDNIDTIGGGYNGQMFALDASSAAKVINVERLEGGLADFELEVVMARAAAGTGVGPEVLDAFPCLADEEGRMVGVIVMRRVKGKTLREWLDASPSAAKREKMAKALEQAVDRLHSASIYHHDLHSTNVMVEGRDDRPVVIDYGSATNNETNKWIERIRKNGKVQHTDYRIVDEVRRGDEGTRQGQIEEARQLTQRVMDDKLFVL
jgi:predicted Ser/Thr protein kinase